MSAPELTADEKAVVARMGIHDADVAADVAVLDETATS